MAKCTVLRFGRLEEADAVTRPLNARQRRALERAYDATGSFCTTWATRNTGLATNQMYAALRQLEARGLVERAGMNLSDWKITPQGMVVVGRLA